MNSQNKSKLSVIIGHYGNGGEVYKCLNSLEKIKNRTKNTEFILVDNNQERTRGIKIKYKWIKYIKTPRNLGWGKARNLGLKHATGNYLLYLDSDMVLDYKSFTKLYGFIKTNKKAGLVAPKMINISGKFTPSGTRELTPLRGIFYLSFMNKYLHNLPIIQKFLMMDWDRKKTKEVGVAQLGVFMMKRKALEDVKGFDENIFLYFEENDLSKNLKKKGWKEFILSEAEVLHLESKGTPKETNEIKRIFRESRFYYFKKHYGLFKALIVEFFARISKNLLLILTMILLGVFLRFYNFIPNIIFNGEMGTDYMNVWNILHGARSWLIGPRTSHEWFFIPPLAYWIYVPVMLLAKMSPISINIFWGIVGTLAIPVSYFYVKKLLSEKIALISSFLVAVSPAWIVQARDARYNLLVSIILFPYLHYLHKSIEDKGKSFLKLGVVVGIMMSFFPSPILLIPAVILSFIFYKVKPKIKDIGNFVLGFLIPNITFLIYEIGNKFQITTNLLSWVPYRILGFVGLYPKNTIDSQILNQNTSSIYKFVSDLFSFKIGVISGSLFIFLTVGIIYFTWKNFKNRNKEKAYFLLVINLFVCIIGLFIHGNPPSHYYYTIFAIPLILMAYFIETVFKNKIPTIVCVLAIGGICISSLIRDNWFYRENVSVPYTTQQKITDSIIEMSQGNTINLKRVGPNDQFENNYANNYIYLLTIKGTKVDPSSENTYTIVEEQNEVRLINP